jgi:hypothetical protein
VISHHVLTALKRLAVRQEVLTARPKRSRFLLLHIAGPIGAPRAEFAIALRFKPSEQLATDWGECAPVDLIGSAA